MSATEQANFMKRLNAHHTMTDKEDAEAKEAIGYAQMSNSERAIYDKVNLAFSKARDEDENNFDI